jgi:hypothetical protein
MIEKEKPDSGPDQALIGRGRLVPSLKMLSQIVPAKAGTTRRVRAPILLLSITL